MTLHRKVNKLRILCDAVFHTILLLQVTCLSWVEMICRNERRENGGGNVRGERPFGRYPFCFDFSSSPSLQVRDQWDVDICFWPTNVHPCVNTVNFSSFYFALASDERGRAFATAASDFIWLRHLDRRIKAIYRYAVCKLVKYISI